MRETRANPQMQTPLTRGDLVLPEIFTKTIKDELFLLHDSGGDSKRFLIFATAKKEKC